MYSLPYFKETEKPVLLRFLHDHPFAFLTGSFPDGRQVATQIPVLVEERKNGLYLQGHFMRNTDHHNAFAQNPQALAIFTGAHAYVSASWYTHPHIGSTWNYMSIHLHGRIRFLPDEELVCLMKKLTLRFENDDTTSPTVYDNLPDPFLKKMLPAIVGFEIMSTEVQNVFKLSQNRDEASYRNIIRKLGEQAERGNAALIAEEMERRLAQLFPPGSEWDAARFLS